MGVKPLQLLKRSAWASYSPRVQHEYFLPANFAPTTTTQLGYSGRRERRLPAAFSVTAAILFQVSLASFFDMQASSEENLFHKFARESKLALSRNANVFIWWRSPIKDVIVACKPGYDRLHRSSS